MNWDAAFLLAGIILIKMVSGSAMGLFGPMLPTLANNCNVDVASAAWIFSARSFAIFVGGNLPNLLPKSIGPLVILMLTGILQLTTLFLIPEIHHLALLIFAVFCIGCVIGIIDVGGQILILKYFKRDSPQLIQLFHFVFNVGAILGNTIVAAYIEPSKEAPCFEEDSQKILEHLNSTIIGQNGRIPEDSLNGTSKERALSVGIDAITSSGTEKEARGFVANDFSMAFHIPAYITILPVILLFILQSLKIIERLNKKQKEKQAPAAEEYENGSLQGQHGTVEGSRLEEIEEDEEEPKEDFHRIKYFILLLNITLFCNTSTQQVVEAYIYEYSRCSPDVSISSEAAATIVTILWVTATISRGTGIIISQIASPKKYILFDYFLVLSALGMLVIRPLITHLYLIVAVIAFSYGIATLYANIIIYTVSVFNVENGYMWVFYIGAQLLPTFNPVLCGQWMQYDKTGFIYFNLTMMVISMFVIPFLFRTGDQLIVEKQNAIESAAQNETDADCCSIDSSKFPTNNPTNIDLTLKKLNLPTPNGSLLDGRSPRVHMHAQLQRLTEVERVVRVSTSVNSIALSIKSATGTYTSGLTEDKFSQLDF